MSDQFGSFEVPGPGLPEADDDRVTLLRGDVGAVDRGQLRSRGEERFATAVAVESANPALVRRIGRDNANHEEAIGRSHNSYVATDSKKAIA